MSTFSDLSQAVIEGNAPAAAENVRTMLAQNVSGQTILNDHLIPAMNEVGRLYDEEEYFVPELLIAARAMQESMKILDPVLKSSGVAKIGRVFIGTVAGDMHDIGKNLVASMLEGGGFEVTDLGVDVSVERFIESAKKSGNGVILALSALLTTTMPQMKAVVDALTAAGIRENVRVMVGGAPVTQNFAEQIGADGYSESANEAVSLARRLTKIA